MQTILAIRALKFFLTIRRKGKKRKIKKIKRLWTTGWRIKTILCEQKRFKVILQEKKSL